MLLISMACLAQPSRLNERMPVWLKAFQVTGVGIGWIEDGKLVWTAFYGDQVPGGPPANARTLYNVASLTKPITAELLLRLAAAGRLSLDEPISPYWVDEDVKDNHWHELLTTRLCLSHQSAFPNWRYQTKNKLQFQWQPGTAFGYSGEGFDYAAHFAEKRPAVCVRAHRDARDFVYASGMVEGQTGEAGGGRIAYEVVRGGSASLHRCDYAKFLIEAMRRDPERWKITRNQTTREMSSVLCKAAKDPKRCSVASGFGLGWHVVKINEEIIVDHTAADSDVKTFAFFHPKRK